MGAMQLAYQKDAIAAAEQGRRLPSTQTLRRITAVIAAKMRDVSHAS